MYIMLPPSERKVKFLMLCSVRNKKKGFPIPCLVTSIEE